MGVVGSLPSENNHTNISDVTNDNHMPSSRDQIPHAQVCMKELRLAAARLEHRRKCDNDKMNKHELRWVKHRQRTRRLKTKNPNIQDQLKKQIEHLELQQNRLLTTVTQLQKYREELEVVCQQIHFNHEHLQ